MKAFLGGPGKEFASGSPRIGYMCSAVMCRDDWAELYYSMWISQLNWHAPAVSEPSIWSLVHRYHACENFLCIRTKSLFSSACFYNFAFFLMPITLVIVL